MGEFDAFAKSRLAVIAFIDKTHGLTSSARTVKHSLQHMVLADLNTNMKFLIKLREVT